MDGQLVVVVAVVAQQQQLLVDDDAFHVLVVVVVGNVPPYGDVPSFGVERQGDQAGDNPQTRAGVVGVVDDPGE